MADQQIPSQVQIQTGEAPAQPVATVVPPVDPNVPAVDNYNFQLNSIPNQPFIPLDLKPAKKKYKMPFSPAVFSVRLFTCILSLINSFIAIAHFLHAFIGVNHPLKFVDDIIASINFEAIFNQVINFISIFIHFAMALSQKDTWMDGKSLGIDTLSSNPSNLPQDMKYLPALIDLCIVMFMVGYYFATLFSRKTWVFLNLFSINTLPVFGIVICILNLAVNYPDASLHRSTIGFFVSIFGMMFFLIAYYTVFLSIIYADWIYKDKPNLSNWLIDYAANSEVYIIKGDNKMVTMFASFPFFSTATAFIYMTQGITYANWRYAIVSNSLLFTVLLIIFLVIFIAIFVLAFLDFAQPRKKIFRRSLLIFLFPSMLINTILLIPTFQFLLQKVYKKALIPYLSRVRKKHKKKGKTPDSKLDELFADAVNTEIEDGIEDGTIMPDEFTNDEEYRSVIKTPVQPTPAPTAAGPSVTLNNNTTPSATTPPVIVIQSPTPAPINNEAVLEIEKVKADLQAEKANIEKEKMEKEMDELRSEIERAKEIGDEKARAREANLREELERKDREMHEHERMIMEEQEREREREREMHRDDDRRDDHRDDRRDDDRRDDRRARDLRDYDLLTRLREFQLMSQNPYQQPVPGPTPYGYPPPPTPLPMYAVPPPPIVQPQYGGGSYYASPSQAVLSSYYTAPPQLNAVPGALPTAAPTTVRAPINGIKTVYVNGQAQQPVAQPQPQYGEKKATKKVVHDSDVAYLRHPDDEDDELYEPSSKKSREANNAPSSSHYVDEDDDAPLPLTSQVFAAPNTYAPDPTTKYHERNDYSAFDELANDELNIPNDEEDQLTSSPSAAHGPAANKKPMMTVSKNNKLKTLYKMYTTNQITAQQYYEYKRRIINSN